MRRSRAARQARILPSQAARSRSRRERARRRRVSSKLRRLPRTTMFSASTQRTRTGAAVVQSWRASAPRAPRGRRRWSLSVLPDEARSPPSSPRGARPMRSGLRPLGEGPTGGVLDAELSRRRARRALPPGEHRRGLGGRRRGTSGHATTAPGSTSAKSAILSRMSRESFLVRAQTITSGWIPMRRSSLTECCVGFVFSSPAASMNGTSVTWMYITFSGPTSRRNWRNRFEERQRLDVADRAADLGDDDVGRRSPRPRARCALSSFVMCGITCTVAPRNSPLRSLRRTVSQTAPALCEEFRERFSSTKRS